MAESSQASAHDSSSSLWLIAGALLLAAIVFSAGLLSGIPLGRASTPTLTERAKFMTYDKVRAANIKLVEQALDNVAGDCNVDNYRCSLSLAYALALDQKFQDELVATPVPRCAATSDQQLRLGLQRVQVSLQQGLASNGPPPAVIAGTSDLQTSDQLYATAGCP